MQELLYFLYQVFFRPVSLYAAIQELDPGLWSVAAALTRPHPRPARPLRDRILFQGLVLPGLLALGTGLLLAGLGLEVNWLKLGLALAVGTALACTFSVPFCIAFLMPFAVTAALWSSLPFDLSMAAFFSLSLGLAYGLGAESARWGFLTALVYGFFVGLLLGPPGGAVIGLAFLVGYFRIVFYWFEAPLSWILARRARRGDALGLWKWNPVNWDERIWLPLPGLGRHLRALRRQDAQQGEAAIRQIEGSLGQAWAARSALEQDQAGRSMR